MVHADRPVNIINTFPNSQDYDTINREGISIVLQMDVTEQANGNISIVSNKEVIKGSSGIILYCRNWPGYHIQLLNHRHSKHQDICCFLSAFEMNSMDKVRLTVK